MKYSIQKTLAFNKRCEVLLANYNDPIHPCLVLVKTVLPDLSDTVIERLKQAMFFNHKNLLGILDFGKCKDFTPIKYYYASRYLPGVTLTQVLSKLDLLQKKAPIPFVLHVIFSLCSALEYIHETVCGSKEKEGILHGNICPDNIHISYDGDIFLTDPGISDIVTHRYTGTIIAKNTETIFQHPEARFGSPQKPSHELYSLSLLFLSLLVGKKYFDQFYDKENPQNIKSIGKAFPSVPEDVVKIIIKGTRFGGFRRFTRFESINGFYHALLKCSFMQSNKFMKEITSLIISTLFNFHDDFSDAYHQSQRIKALEYIRDSNDNSLKVLLRNHFKGMLPEESDQTPTETFADLLDTAFDEFTEPYSSDVVDDSPVYINVDTEETPLLMVDQSPPAPPSVRLPQSPEPQPTSPKNGDRIHQALPAVTSTLKETHRTMLAVASQSEKMAVKSTTSPSSTNILNGEQLMEKSKETSKPIGEFTDTATMIHAGSEHAESSEKNSDTSVPSNDSPRKNSAIFGTRTIGKKHPFSKIVVGTPLIDADIYTMDNRSPPIQYSEKTDPVSTSSAFDSFETLLKNPLTSDDHKYLEPFSNLLKKESHNV